MRRIHIFLCCLLVNCLLANSLFAQTDYAYINILVRVNPKYEMQLSYDVYFDKVKVQSILANELLICKVPTGTTYSVNVTGSLGAFFGIVDPSTGKNSVYRAFGGKGIINDFHKWTVVDSSTVHSIETPTIKKIYVEKRGDEYYRMDKIDKSGSSQGTCFAISGSYVITNFHVIDNAKEITVKGIDGDFSTKYGASVVASDKTNDLAILKINNKNVKFDSVPYSMKTSGIQQGEKVYAMGFPVAVAMGNEVKLTDGIISAKSGVEGDISKFQISAAVNHGNSGGPLIDEQGDVIGVIYAKSTLAESAGYAVKAAYLETFLKNVDGFEYPNLINKIKDKPLTDKIAEWKKYIFIVETN